MSSAPKKLFFLSRLCDKNEAISFSVIFSMNLMRRGSINSKPKSTFQSSAPTLCYSQSSQTVLSFSNFLTKLRKIKMNFKSSKFETYMGCCHFVSILGWLFRLLDIHIWAKSTGTSNFRGWATALRVDHCHSTATDSLWHSWLWPHCCSSLVSVR